LPETIDDEEIAKLIIGKKKIIYKDLNKMNLNQIHNVYFIGIGGLG
jgi:D-arabinose 1-dehydrogenase-like Zn-dependent alcohol dehydrogenase